MHGRFLLRPFLVALSAAAMTRARVPPPPERVGPIFSASAFTSQEEARRTVVPMAGSLPVTLHGTGDRQYLTLPGNYLNTDHDRCSWDIRLDADLALAKGIRFWFYVQDGSPVASYAVYFRSGDGWYRAGFSVTRDGEWQEVLVNKGDTGAEERPGGWATIDTIRISAWRARSNSDSEFGLAHLGPVGADASIIVLRADSAAGGSESRTIANTAGRMTRCLEELGIETALLADMDATPERLRGRRLVILPYNPSLPQEAAAALTDFVSSGGKLMAFYSLPDPLPALLGIRRGQWVRPRTGRMRGMSRVGDGVKGQPEFVGQASWNAQLAQPVAGRSRAIAVWRDAGGEDTDLPSLVMSDTGVHMSHILLSDDWPEKRRLMLSLVGSFVPGVWERAAEAAIQRIGRIDSHGSLHAVRQAVLGGPAAARAAAEVQRADSLRTAARQALAQDRHDEAITQAQAAQDAALRAWCMSRPTQTGEQRAFWCHSAFGLPYRSWDEAIALLAENGFNAILPNMLWAGVAYYPSEVLPAYAELERRGDQVQLCLDACRRHGVECHVWKVNWNLGSRTDAAFVRRMTAVGRVQQDIDGTVRERWLCPSHPANQALEIESMVELVRNYPLLHGIHFDYIRYPGRSSCFCDGCRERFAAQRGRAVPNWPRGVRDDEDLHAEWLDWRRAQITHVVAEVSRRARAVRETIQISAAVFRNWPVDRDTVGQDWGLWCRRGYLDFVCPMDYTDSNQTFANFVRNQVEWSAGVPCYPGIGLSVWSDPTDVVKLIQQIEITRTFHTGGFTVFDFGANVEQVLPYCALGTTSR